MTATSAEVVKQVVILAGGLGTRLRPLTEKCPKPMVPVRGQPFLHWQLLDLKAQGFTDILLLVAYLGEQIEAHFGDGAKWGLKIRYAYESEPLGTGGALKNAQSLLAPSFLLLNGDSFLKAPLRAMSDFFVEHQLDAVISTYDNRVPVPVIPNLKSHGAHVTAYLKDAAPELGFDQIDSGIYILKRSLVEAQTNLRFMLAELWPALLAKRKLGAYLVPERFYDIGTPERLKEFEEKVHDYFPDSTAH